MGRPSEKDWTNYDAASEFGKTSEINTFLGNLRFWDLKIRTTLGNFRAIWSQAARASAFPARGRACGWIIKVMTDRDHNEVRWTTSYRSHRWRRSTVEHRLRHSDIQYRYNVLSALRRTFIHTHTHIHQVINNCLVLRQLNELIIINGKQSAFRQIFSIKSYDVVSDCIGKIISTVLYRIPYNIIRERRTF